MTDNRTITVLPLLSCYFVELPDERVECSQSDLNLCVQCKILGRFLAGGDLGEIGSAGHTISILIWILTTFVGIAGTLTNCLIIAVIRRQNSKRAFDTFLLVLACFDMIGCIMAVIGSTSTVVMFEDWNRGLTTQYFVYFGTFTCYFARSGSSLLTVMITFERYLAIAFPTRSLAYFTETKTKIICVVFFAVASFLVFPRFASFAISENRIWHDIPSLSELDYIFVATSQERFWYGTLKASVSVLDFWLPFPILFILNVLTFIEIRKFTNKRKEMSVKFKKEINAVKMFIPVTLFLFICNIVGYFHWYYIVFERFAYREIFLGLFLSVALNAFANFFFYMRSDAFRTEFSNLMPECFPQTVCHFPRKIITSSEKKSQDSEPTLG